MPRLHRAPKRRRLASQEDALATNIVLPRALHERLTIAALRLNCSLAQVLRDAAEEFLARHAKAIQEAKP